MEGLQPTAPDSASGADRQFHLVANSVAKLVETAKRELERDREEAKASLVTASHIPASGDRALFGRRRLHEGRSGGFADASRASLH